MINIKHTAHTLRFYLWKEVYVQKSIDDTQGKTVLSGLSKTKCGHVFYTASNNINYKSKKKCIKCLKRKDQW